jgi:hypothetical protein
LAVPLNTLHLTPYNIAAPQVLVDVVPLRGEHKIYTTAAARVTDTWNPNPALPVLSDFAAVVAPAGNTIYLPYNDDRITSVRLPNPPPGGVNFFLTANMSGCKFFVDAIGGSNDLMVYHANTHQHGSPAHGSPVNSQTPAALAILDAMHANAQADYAAAPHNLVLNNVASLAKQAYYLQGANAERRKERQGRGLSVLQSAGVGQPTVNVWVAPEFAGGCSVMGFYNGGWHFYYQTWGDVDYTRPSGSKAIAKDLFTFGWKSLHNRRTKGIAHTLFSDITVVDHALIS